MKKEEKLFMKPELNLYSSFFKMKPILPNLIRQI